MRDSQIDYFRGKHWRVMGRRRQLPRGGFAQPRGNPSKIWACESHSQAREARRLPEACLTYAALQSDDCLDEGQQVPRRDEEEVPEALAACQGNWRLECHWQGLLPMAVWEEQGKTSLHARIGYSGRHWVLTVQHLASLAQNWALVLLFLFPCGDGNFISYT